MFGELLMKTYIIDDSSIEAESFEAAFQKAFGNLVHKEVSKDDFYDVTIKCDEEEKYFWIRSG